MNKQLLKALAPFMVTSMLALPFAGCANPAAPEIIPEPTPIGPEPKPKPPEQPKQLPTPELSVSNGKLLWNRVENAKGYVVTHGTESRSFNQTAQQQYEYELPEYGDYAVQAKGDGDKFLDSTPAKIITKEPIFEPIKDVEFGKIDGNKTKGAATLEIKAKINELIAQSMELEKQYANLPSDDPARTNGFMDEIINKQKGIRSNYSYNSVNDIIIAMNGFGSLPNKLGNLLPNSKDRELYTKQIQAFQKANTLACRNKYHDIQKPGLEADFTKTWTAAMGNEPMPVPAETDMDSSFPIAAAAARQLKELLLNSIPESAGLPAPNIIQQIEDFAQFQGWTDDWQAYYNNISGLQSVTVASATENRRGSFTIIHPTDAAIARAMPRKKTEAENGIVV